MRAWWLAALTAVGCGARPGGQFERVHAGEVTLTCPASGPVVVALPPGALVDTWRCTDAGRCVPVPHTLRGDRVEVPCTASTAEARRVRWMAPVR